MKCVYSLVNLENGHRYIGSSINYERRKREHLNDLIQNKHSNDHLQKARNKFGSDKFIFLPLSVIDTESRAESIEQAWLDGYRPEYNIAIVADRRIGFKHSAETLAKIRKNPTRYWLGKKRSPEDIAKMSASKKGQKLTAEHRAKIGLSLIGRAVSTETRRKIGSSNKISLKGRHLTEEHKKNIKAGVWRAFGKIA